MQFSTITAVSILSALAAAAPAATVVSKAADGAQWTIQSFQRICNTVPATQCNWTFTINTNDGSPTTACAFSTFAQGSTPADQAPETGASCGGYTVSSGWSGQFGPGNGFTTLAVVNNAARLIVYPAYTDVQLASGTPVTPDQSYPVIKL